MCFAKVFDSCSNVAWSTALYDYCAVMRFLPCIFGF